MQPKLYYSREEMFNINRDKLAERGVSIDDITVIAFNQQKRYYENVEYNLCKESVEKILSLRDIFHLLQLGAEIDRLAEEGLFKRFVEIIIY